MNEASRNPYIPTQAPLLTDGPAPPKSPLESDGVVEYGGFWRRVGALLIDFLILSPLLVITYFGVQYSKLFYVWYFVPGILLALFYQVWLVQKNGGTPGKRILGMRIALVGGGQITPKAALLRYSVIGTLTVIQQFALLLATRNIRDEAYYPLGYLQKSMAMAAAAPPYYSVVTRMLGVWMLAVAISMLCNHRRRALHDFIAGTVVLRER